MSIYIGIAVGVDGRPPVIWQKVKGQKLMLKEAGFKRFASWEFDERLMAGRPLVIGRDVSLWTSSRDGDTEEWFRGLPRQLGGVVVPQPKEGSN